ncbi:MAG: hypothetical protein ACTSRK_20395, partial [Promethearchaeota archaeon]
FFIPEFYEFDSVYDEARAWITLFDSNKQGKPFLESIGELKQASRQFFMMDYGPLLFSSILRYDKMNNSTLALLLEAQAEHKLGDYYIGNDDFEQASLHLNFAAIAFASLEDFDTSKKIKLIRKGIRMERTCWICGTKSRGYQVNFNFRYIRLDEIKKKHVFQLLKQRQEINPIIFEDMLYSTANPNVLIDNFDKRDPGLYLSVCKVCGGLLEQLSQDVVDEALIPIKEEILRLSADLNAVRSAIVSIQNAITSNANNIQALGNELREIARYSHEHT